ncbi:MAG: putative photosynthetic complex assembly protein PuhE [Woeseiaceae bacterium]|nr:putative photosynthetic complex assembly protein PuhE [Woeseiaceae bacterium]
MAYALPIAFAVAAWWLSTVLIIYRAGLPQRSFVTTLAGTTVVMLVGLYALVVSRNDTSALAPYLAFFGALAVWAWHEVSYLFGFVNGPRPEACPPDTSGWRRFVLGVKTCVYHELAIVATAIAIGALLWNASNQVGLWTFVILWLMRWSAKLNIFLGVRNLHDEFWPEHLLYLKSFVRRRNMNELFPVSIIAATLALGMLGFAAATAGEDTFQRTAAMLLATLLALATVEHWLLILNIRDDVLWRPGMRSRHKGGVAN